MIYLDNAATTYPKPREVVREMQKAITVYGGNPGRSGHTLAVKAAETVFETREALSDLFGLNAPEQVIFTLNATHALNMAISGLSRFGDHILISDIEHNAVWRPVHNLKGCSYSIYSVSHADPHATLRSIETLIRPETKILIANHRSNICGITAPINALGHFCRHRGLIFIVDASQSAGIEEIDMERDCIDILCAPGHKGLYGPQGCGVMLVGRHLSRQISPAVYGGNGVDSLLPTMPETLPEGLEAGTVPTPAIAGLLRGVQFVKKMTPRRIRDHEAALCCRAAAGLRALPNIRLYGDAPGEGAVLLFNAAGRSATQLAEMYSDAGICVRAGLHCCPLAHGKLATGPEGAVRISFSYFNTPAECDRFLSVTEAMVKRSQL